MKLNKTEQNSAFFQLDKRRQKAVVLLFEDELSDEEIAKSVNRSRTTLNTWKNEELFQRAMSEYRRIAIDDFVPNAINELKSLVLGSRSDMVKFQAIMAILNLSGFGSTDEAPEITEAKIRKTKAEADIAQKKAELLSGSNGDITVNINPFEEDS